MDQVTKVKKYLKREQWKTLIKDCQSSGMTVKDWCAANDICESSSKRCPGNKGRCQPANRTGSAPCTAESMLGDITVAENIYIACGYTDMRKSIDGLAVIVQEQFQLDPFSKSLFLFCGKRRDRIKCLLWEGDGFLLLYKRLENGSFKWPRKESEVRPISWQQFRWLMEGLEIEQKSIILPAEKASLC